MEGPTKRDYTRCKEIPPGANRIGVSRVFKDRMWRKKTIIGMLGLLLLTSTAQWAPSYCRIISSAKTFQENFETLGGSRTTLNPVERFVFSLLLANRKNQTPSGGAADHRTT